MRIHPIHAAADINTAVAAVSDSASNARSDFAPPLLPVDFTSRLPQHFSRNLFTRAPQDLAQCRRSAANDKSSMQSLDRRLTPILFDG